MQPVTFVHKESVSKNAVLYWFKSDQPLSYEAGQFIELTIPHQADNRGQRRWFTLSSSPTEELLAITTKSSAPSSTFKKQLQELSPGDQVTMSQPMGDFVLPQDISIPLLFVVGGIGITPVRSILTYLSDRQEQRTVRVLYAASTEQDILFRDTITGLDPAAQYFISRNDNRLTVQHILDTAATLHSPIMYLSGPEEFVELLVRELANSGVSSSRLVTDYFQGYGDQIVR